MTLLYSFYPILLWDFVGLSFYRNSKEYQEQDLYSKLISWQKNIIKKKLKGNIIGENIWSKKLKGDIIARNIYSKKLKGDIKAKTIS